MCHSDDSRPPKAPGAGTAGEQRQLELTAADGNRFAAHLARSGEPSRAGVSAGAGIVIMPDVRGLHEFYRELATRYAEIGVDAVAIDYFGRTAGSGDRSEGFDYRPHVEQTTPEGVAADVAAAVAYLRAEAGVRSVFTVGFCFGGGYSWRQSADTPGLSGAIGFYGRPQPAAEVVEQMSAPLLMLVAGADANIPVADVEQVAVTARERGIETEFVVYPDAPHSFFDRSFAEHRQECDDAWTRIRAFISAHSAG